jgi:hypothetical protein
MLLSRDNRYRTTDREKLYVYTIRGLKDCELWWRKSIGVGVDDSVYDSVNDGINSACNSTKDAFDTNLAVNIAPSQVKQNRSHSSLRYIDGSTPSEPELNMYSHVLLLAAGS